MPFLLGLTGNIACGKSTVGTLLAERHGAEYVDADRLVHELYLPGTPEHMAIVDRFGAAYQREDGTIDRSRLGERVMSSPGDLRDLEAILHPGVGRLIAERVAGSEAPVVVVDAIKLIEAGIADHCDWVWVVVCPRELQLERLRATRGFTVDQAALRVDAQPPQEAKVHRATVVIRNDGDLASLAAQVEDAWQETVAPALAVGE